MATEADQLRDENETLRGDNKTLVDQVETLRGQLASAQAGEYKAKKEAEHLKQAAMRARAQFDGTHRELNILVQRIEEHRYHKEVAQAARDDVAAMWQAERNKVFEMQNMIDERVAAAEGKAMYYKKWLVRFLRVVDETKELLARGDDV